MQKQKLIDTIALMRKTGTDDSQYVLVSVRDLEELLEAYDMYEECRNLMIRMHQKIFPDVKENGDETEHGEESC
jgi:hypothetical protein